jgi:O-antigen/teichoic acid export membrane protein
MNIEEGNVDTLLSSSILILVGIFLSSVSQLLERIVIGRWFSLEAYGEVSLAIAIMGMVSTITSLGLNHGVPRYISRYDDGRDVRGIWVTAAVIAVGTSVVAAFLLYAYADLFVGFFFERSGSTRLVRLFVLAIPLSALFTVVISGIRGFENTRYKLYTTDVLYPGLRLFVLVALVVLGVGVYSAGYAYVVGLAVSIVVGFYFFGKLTDLVGPVRPKPRRLLAFSAPLAVSMLLGVFLTRMDTFMIAYFKSSAQVGLYTAAFPLSRTLGLVLSSFGYVYLPLTSRLDADGEREELTNVYRLTTKWSFILTFPAFLVFLLFGTDVLSIFFGDQFGPGGVALAILSVGVFTGAALGRNRETLSALGDTNEIMGADVVALGLNLVLNLALIPPYGIGGAAVASAASFALRNLVINGVLWTRYGITPFSRELTRIYVLVPVALIPPAAVSSAVVSLSVLTLPVALVVFGLAVLLVVSVVGGWQLEDLLAVEFVEGIAGFRIPYVRRVIGGAEEPG